LKLSTLLCDELEIFKTSLPINLPKPSLNLNVEPEKAIPNLLSTPISLAKHPNPISDQRTTTPHLTTTSYWRMNKYVSNPKPCFPEYITKAKPIKTKSIFLRIFQNSKTPPIFESNHDKNSSEKQRKKQTRN